MPPLSTSSSPVTPVLHRSSATPFAGRSAMWLSKVVGCAPKAAQWRLYVNTPHAVAKLTQSEPATTSAELLSPRILATVIVVELAGVFRAESREQTAHGLNAFLGRQLCIGSAHIGFDPSGIHNDAGDSAGLQIERAGTYQHVHRGLRGAIQHGAA